MTYFKKTGANLVFFLNSLYWNLIYLHQSNAAANAATITLQKFLEGSFIFALIISSLSVPFETSKKPLYIAQSRVIALF